MNSDETILRQLEYGREQFATGQIDLASYLDYTAITIYPKLSQAPMGQCPVCGFSHAQDAALMNHPAMPRA